MTSAKLKKAKNILANKLKPCIKGTYWEDALNVAINLIEQQLSGELISKEIMRDALYDYVQDVGGDNYEQMVSHIETYIKIEMEK